MAIAPLALRMPPVRLRNLWETLTSTLWFVPSLITATSIGLAVGAVTLDRTIDADDMWFFLYSGGPEGARAVLATTAGSMITVAGIAFSTTMVALSFASAQLGPRLLRNFMRDRVNQIVLGTLVATFVYSMFVLRTVSEAPEPFVPHIGVSVGLVLALASLGVLIHFIHHAALSLQADYVIGVVAHELHHSIDEMYPGGMGNDAPPERCDELARQANALRAHDATRVTAPRSGYVHALDVETLMHVATKNDLVVQVLSRPGKFLHEGVPIAVVWPATAARPEVCNSVRRAFVTGRTRTSQQDVEFAVNQLVEVAARALSPGVNDPFTALTCIDRLTTAILRLMRRDFPPRFRLDDEGRLRVIADRPDFQGIVDAAFHQIRQSGATLPAVTIHLLECLGLLLEHARTDEHRRALERHIHLVRRAGVRESDEPEDREDMNERVRKAEERA